MTRPTDILPLSCPPRGLNREKSALYVGVGTSLYDEMVEDGRMPKPKRVNSRNIWDRLELDEAFSALPSDDDTNPWDSEDAT